MLHMTSTQKASGCTPTIGQRIGGAPIWKETKGMTQDNPAQCGDAGCHGGYDVPSILKQSWQCTQFRTKYRTFLRIILCTIKWISSAGSVTTT